MEQLPAGEGRSRCQSSIVAVGLGGGAVKRERSRIASNLNKESLDLIIYTKRAMARRTKLYILLDRSQLIRCHRYCANRLLLVPSTHRAACSSPRLVLDEVRVLTVPTSRSLDAAGLRLQGGGVRCLRVKSVCCDGCGRPRGFFGTFVQYLVWGLLKKIRMMEANDIHLSGTLKSQSRDDTD